ncbi:phage major tail tube protein [Thalassobius sp. I31.1]|uniref:phage major tail tube protein n=1 Tax=Thalassobius sp. I31.1 TaxID=2109912 RepID=UPI000D19B554|nr:phage major tail tube protein [Thalassobius sp. I31.1]
MRDILQYVGIFADGRGYFGDAQKVMLPKMTIATKEFNASGMSGPIKVRMSRLASALETTLTFGGLPSDLYDLLTVSEGEEIPFRFKGSTQGADGTTHAHMIVARGFVEEFDEGTWADAEDAPLNLKISLRHYERHIDGVEKWAVNPEGMILRRNGVDLLAQHRANIGR